MNWLIFSQTVYSFAYFHHFFFFVLFLFFLFLFDLPFFYLFIFLLNANEWNFYWRCCWWCWNIYIILQENKAASKSVKQTRKTIVSYRISFSCWQWQYTFGMRKPAMDKKKNDEKDEIIIIKEKKRRKPKKILKKD